MLRGKILIVNVDTGDIVAYAKLIAALGLDVEICDSYEEGARQITAENFDFLIVGQGGAAFEGRRILERAMQLHRRIPSLVVARSANLHNYLEAMELGAVDYLETPEPEDLTWVLETEMNRSHGILLQGVAQ